MFFSQDITAFETLLQNQETAIEGAQNPIMVREDTLKNYHALVLIGSSIDTLDHRQQRDVERFVWAGGVVVGISLSTKYQRKWPWMEQMLMAFQTDSSKSGASSSTEIPEVVEYAVWQQNDGAGSICLLNPQTPVDVPAIVKNIHQIVGDIKDLDYTEVNHIQVPSADRFSDTILVDQLNEPIELEILNNGDVLFIERRGSIKYFSKTSQETRTLAVLKVNHSQSNGLNGLALDPDFEQNRLVYLSYTPPNDLYHQHISSFILSPDEFLLDTEKIIMKIPIDARDGNHAENALEFDNEGNLYIGMGDFTREPTGYAAIDERKGNEHSDAQRTASNSNDYRGKILRIHPQPDGTYIIPDHNLFPKDGSEGRPEIYIMGCRNPYRFSIDPVSNHLFWGDIGPDAGKDSLRGPRGYDEINQTNKAGFYGWPYLVADNKPYRDYDYEAQKIGEPFNPAGPINNSPNNTGIRQLPPSRPAILWYPYDNTFEFPYMGNGGMNIMAGPLYRFNAFPATENKLPEYYDGKLFIYDWVRNWIRAVTLDEKFQVVAVEPFLEQMTFAKPIDMKISADGSLYILEYGSTGYAANKDARIRHIQYAKGNRPPQAHIKSDKTAGATPLTINLSAEGSFDPDNDDSLQFSWQFEGEKTRKTGREVQHVYMKSGIYYPTLRVTDQHGASSESRVEIKVGNALPEISLEIEGNQSFYWGVDTLNYQIKVEDQEDGSLEDGSIDTDKVKVEFSFLPSKNTSSSSMETTVEGITKGESLVTESGCLSCHTTYSKSVGPSYLEISQRYDDSDKNVDLLAEVITNGGRGNWLGNFSMPAHPHLTKEQARNIVAYIFSVKGHDSTINLPVKGAIVTNQHNSEIGGNYLLKVTYTDAGAGPIEPIEQSTTFVFRHHQVNPVTCDDYKGVVMETGNSAVFIDKSSYLKFKKLDLSGIRKIVFNAKAGEKGELTLRLDAPDGPVIGKYAINDPKDEWREIKTSIKASSALHDLYFVYTGEESIPAANKNPLLIINKISFELD